MGHKVIAIVPCAGLGKRFGEGRNKPFETLGSKPVMIWCLEVFQKMAEITEVIPVVKDADMQAAEGLFRDYKLGKILHIARGGKERQDSVFNGLKLVTDRDSIVLIHDGVRPLIEPRTVLKALSAMQGCDGVVVGVPPKDTIKEIAGEVVRRTLTRDDLFAAHTPQVFFYKPLMEAYEKAMKEAFYATDDAALVERNNGKVKVVRGEYTNIKVTTPEDIALAEVFLKMREEGQ